MFSSIPFSSYFCIPRGLREMEKKLDTSPQEPILQAAQVLGPSLCELTRFLKDVTST